MSSTLKNKDTLKRISASAGAGLSLGIVSAASISHFTGYQDAANLTAVLVSSIVSAFMMRILEK